MVEYAGGRYNPAKALKAVSGWNSRSGLVCVGNGNGADDYGFSALPGGWRNDCDGSFNGVGDDGTWWSASGFGSTHAYSRTMYYYDGGVHEGGNVSKGKGHSVRCVRDD